VEVVPDQHQLAALELQIQVGEVAAPEVPTYRRAVQAVLA